MCGITGFWTEKPTDTPFLQQMANSLRHRGPNSQGYFLKSPKGDYKLSFEALPFTQCVLGLGFRRLAILDLSSAANQPMFDENKKICLVFNGEVYNFQDLKKTVSQKNFRTQTDSEVVATLLAERGAQALNEFNGMFGLAWYDKDKKELNLARDRYGVKPLYFTVNSRGFFFASEIRALLPALDQVEIEENLIAQHLLQHWTLGRKTLIRGIYRVLPGEHIVLKTPAHWQATSWVRAEEDSSSENLEHVFAKVLKRQLNSDVPLGFFLSGGVDSSLLVALAKLQGYDPKTFTVGIDWGKNSSAHQDLVFAKKVSQKLGVDHQEINVQPKLFDLLPEVVDALEEPVSDPAALCSYLLCQQASKNFKVLISGQGADEYWGGYEHYQLANLFSGGMKTSARLASHLFFFSRKWKKLGARLAMPWPESLWGYRGSMQPAEVQGLLGERYQKPFEEFHFIAKDLSAKNPLEQILELDQKTYLWANNLLYGDKTSMAHSIEMRVPFLDNELVKASKAIKPAQKISKQALKGFAAEYLPKDVVYRKKEGFGVPLKEWFQGPLHSLASEYLNANRLKQDRVFNPELCEKWLKEHKAGTHDHAMKLFTLLTFELWKERMVKASVFEHKPLKYGLG